MDAELVKAILLLALGGVGGYAARTFEFNRQQKKEEKVQLRDNLNVLHAGVLQIAHSFSIFATNITEYAHGEHGDLPPLTAISKFTQPSSEKMADLHSLQRRYAPEFTEILNSVRNTQEKLYVIGAQVLINQSTLPEVTKTLNLLIRKLNSFAVNIEDKLSEL